jgi:exoribonuclease R
VNPFRYGALALDEAFTNREDEIRELTRDILNGQDVVVLAPRRYGKTSLLWRVMQEVVKKKVLVAQVNLMTTPTKERLAEKLADSIYEHIASALFRARERLRIFADLRIRPIITIDPVDARDFDDAIASSHNQLSGRAGSASARCVHDARRGPGFRMAIGPGACASRLVWGFEDI